MKNSKQPNPSRSPLDQRENSAPDAKKHDRLLQRILAKIRQDGSIPAVPANDNSTRQRQKVHTQASLDNMGSPYRSAATKMWWLP